MKIENFRTLFETGLRYAYDCEQKLVKKGIPSMIEASKSQELRSALEQHLQETRQHVLRIERIFSILGVEAKKEDDDVIDEITKAAERMIKATDEGSPLRDAVVIVGGNEVEHYEIAVYGSLVSFAKRLGLNEAADLLEQTLNEEKAADAKLTAIGERSVNEQAARERRAA